MKNLSVEEVRKRLADAFPLMGECGDGKLLAGESRFTDEEAEASLMRLLAWVKND